MPGHRGKPQPVHARIDFEVDGPRGFGLPEFTDQRFELFFGVNSGLQSVLKQGRKGVGCGVQNKDAAGDAVRTQFHPFFSARDGDQGHAVELQHPRYRCCVFRTRSP